MTHWSYDTVTVGCSILSYVRLPVVSPGHEGVFPDSSCPLHPVPDIPGRQSLFRTEEHALLR